MSIQPAEVLKYKPDWPEARQRHQAFWEREIVDRVCLAIRAPQDEQVPMPVAETYEAAVTDIDYHLSVQRALLNNTYYGGDALPGIDTKVGWLAFGGEPIFMEEVDTLPGLEFTPGAAAWATVGTLAFLDLYKRIQQAGKCAVIHARYDEVEPLLQELDPRGIFIHTSAPSVEAADTLARDAIRWSCRGVFPAASVPPSEAPENR